MQISIFSTSYLQSGLLETDALRHVYRSLFMFGYTRWGSVIAQWHSIYLRQRRCQVQCSVSSGSARKQPYPKPPPVSVNKTELAGAVLTQHRKSVCILESYKYGSLNVSVRDNMPSQTSPSTHSFTSRLRYGLCPG